MQASTLYQLVRQLYNQIRYWMNSLLCLSLLDSDGYEFVIVSLDNKQWHFEAQNGEVNFVVFFLLNIFFSFPRKLDCSIFWGISFICQSKQCPLDYVSCLCPYCRTCFVIEIICNPACQSITLS